jgi:S-(hydroxymethyl)mycothiol dehydrogenase
MITPSDSHPINASAMVCEGPGIRPRIESITVLPPGPGEVRVRILASGICHTDSLVYRGLWWRDYPYVLGHEGAGVIESIGPGVPAELVGKTVVLAWRTPCLACRACLGGRTWMCVDPPSASGRLLRGDNSAVTPSLRLGTHATYAVISATQAILVPDGLRPEALCLIGCAVTTGIGAVRNTAAVWPGQRVVVIGCGGVGLSVVIGARLAMASTIVAVDRDPSKLELAGRLGATDVVLAGAGDVVATVRQLAGGFGVDHAFEAVGTSETVAQALACCDVGGSCVVSGTPPAGAHIELSLEKLYLARAILKFSQYGDAIPSRDIPDIVGLYAAGQVDLDSLVTGVVDLDQGADIVASGGTHGVRTVISFGWESADAAA